MHNHQDQLGQGTVLPESQDTFLTHAFCSTTATKPEEPVKWCGFSLATYLSLITPDPSWSNILTTAPNEFQLLVSGFCFLKKETYLFKV